MTVCEIDCGINTFASFGQGEDFEIQVTTLGDLHRGVQGMHGMHGMGVYSALRCYCFCQLIITRP